MRTLALVLSGVGLAQRDDTSGVEAIAGAYAPSYDAGDFDAIHPMYADDVIDVVSNGLVMEGNAPVRALLSSLYDDACTRNRTSNAPVWQLQSGSETGIDLGDSIYRQRPDAIDERAAVEGGRLVTEHERVAREATFTRRQRYDGRSA